MISIERNSDGERIQNIWKLNKLKKPNDFKNDKFLVFCVKV